MAAATEAEVAALRAQLATVRAQLATVRAQLVVLTQRATRAETAITALQQQVAKVKKG